MGLSKTVADFETRTHSPVDIPCHGRAEARSPGGHYEEVPTSCRSNQKADTRKDEEISAGDKNSRELFLGFGQEVSSTSPPLDKVTI